jgi:hypothetical protein
LLRIAQAISAEISDGNAFAGFEVEAEFGFARLGSQRIFPSG